MIWSYLFGVERPYVRGRDCGAAMKLASGSPAPAIRRIQGALAAISPEAVWHLANPGLASGIKSIEYMRLLNSGGFYWLPPKPIKSELQTALDLNELDGERLPARWFALLAGLAGMRHPPGEAYRRGRGRAIVGFDAGGFEFYDRRFGLLA